MPTKKTNFADDFAELEAIVQRFERGDIDLDEGLKEFERGLQLAEQLKKKLESTAHNISEIKEKFSDDAA